MKTETAQRVFTVFTTTLVVALINIATYRVSYLQGLDHGYRRAERVTQLWLDSAYRQCTMDTLLDLTYRLEKEEP